LGFATLALGAALLTVSGCDVGEPSNGPSAACTEAGAQCTLPSGPLGVCERSPCPPDATGPCFACISQH